MTGRNLWAFIIKWRRRHLSDNQFMLLISLLVGVFTALAGLLLKWLIEFIEHWLTHEFNIAAGHLNRPIEQVAATLAHEMTHFFCQKMSPYFTHIFFSHSSHSLREFCIIGCYYLYIPKKKTPLLNK